MAVPATRGQDPLWIREVHHAVTCELARPIGVGITTDQFMKYEYALKSGF